MNILYYCDEYPPAKTGGIGSVTRIVAEEMVRRGHKVYVVGYYPYNYELPQYSEINGVGVYRLNMGLRKGLIRNKIYRNLHKVGLSNCFIQRELDYTEDFIRRLVADRDIDVLELTDYYAFDVARKKLRFRKFDVPTVLRVHGSLSFLNSLSGSEQRGCDVNDALHFMRCDYLSVVSRYSLQYIESNFDTEHFKGKNVIYNPVEEDFFHRCPPATDSRTILFVGRLIETKGCYSLLKAFDRIAPEYRDWKLVMAGSGNQKLAASFVSPENRAQVSFTGFCDREELKRQIDNCSFACFPSYFENFSMAALEVMARQKALIFTERTSGREVIDDGVDGLLVNPEDIGQIVGKLTLLIENRALRDRMADNAYFKVKNNFSTPAICDRMEEFYRSILAPKNR